ncbi:hypothetical protein [Subtercola lobariae]|uniref:hypothetical protein n=1 Tax=Subtercola lobariae TaxID=1588641 RepID=UPI001664031F|nr:hypothetical protein [Subtercola lobariae]
MFVAFVGGIVALGIGASTGDIPFVGYNGPRFGCGFQNSSSYQDGTSRTSVQGCVAPGFPSSIPLLQSTIVTGTKETGADNYVRYDVVISTPDLDAAKSSIPDQLTGAGYTPVANDDASEPHDVFENEAYKVYLTYSRGGLHGDTVEYYVVPEGSQ